MTPEVVFVRDASTTAGCPTSDRTVELEEARLNGGVAWLEVMGRPQSRGTPRHRLAANDVVISVEGTVRRVRRQAVHLLPLDRVGCWRCEAAAAELVPAAA
jgi:hypothetical protein